MGLFTDLFRLYLDAALPSAIGLSRMAQGITQEIPVGYSPDPEQIKKLLELAIHAYPPPHDTSLLIDTCHKMAVSYLVMKWRRGQFHLKQYGIPLDDVALDAIADLFACDATGCLSVIKRYFSEEGRRLDQLSADDAFGMLRRLVFSAVSNRLFRLLAEFNPALTRIIRNIKLALRKHPSMTSIRFQGRRVLIPTSCLDRSRFLPEIPPEIMEVEFGARISFHSPLAEMLEVLGTILAEQECYGPIYPLTATAHLVLSVYATCEPPLPTVCFPSVLMKSEIEALLTRVLAKVGMAAQSTYLTNGKRNIEELRTYQRALNHVFREKWSWDGGERISLFRALREHLPELSFHDYHRFHRDPMEYMAKMIRREMQTVLKMCTVFPQ